MHTTSSIIPFACGIEEATDTNAQPILSQHEIRIRLRVGVSVRDRTMVRFRGFHRSRGDLTKRKLKCRKRRNIPILKG